MLVLSRKAGQSIKVGDGIYVTVVRIGPNTVLLGITAPRDMNIARSELIVELDGDVEISGDAEMNEAR